MARATKRTSVLLGALALVFIIIIVILCIVPKGGSPPDYTQELQKSKEISDVYTDTSTASTTTTTSVPMTTTPTTTTTTTTPATTSATTPATTSATTTPTTTTPESTIVMTTPTTDDESAVFSTTDDSFFNDTTLDDSLSSDTTLSTTDDSLSNDTTVDDSLSSDTTLSTTDDSLSNDTTLDDSLSSDTTLATTDDSLSNDTTLEDSHFSDTTISTTDDSLSSDTTLDDSLSSDTTLSTTDDSLSNDTTLDDSLSSDTTLSTTDDSLSNDTTFDDYSFNDTTLSTTDDDLNDTSSESTTLSPTHQPTTTPLRTSISTEQPTTTTTTTTAETTDEEPSPTPTATTTSPSCSAQETCNTPACKTVAANMLAMMDHREGVDPCQDFYQYACGGLMQNPFLDATNHYVISKRLIKDQLETTDRDNTTTVGKMRIFYDSCLNAVDQDATKGWNQTVKKTFGEHRFAVPSKSGVAPLNLTNILAHMILHDFAPFFDMNMDVNPKDNEAFTLTLHPAVPGSPFSEDLARKVCLEDHHRRLENLGGTNSYDVEEEYKTFTNCVLSGNGLMARLDRMEEAVQRFGLLDDLGDSAMASQVLQATKSKAESLLQDLAKMLPSVPKLKQNLANKYYDLVPVANLTHNVINWMELVQLLITVRDISNVKVLQYSKNDIEGILTVLQRYNDDDPVALSNVLLMLWSEKLYTDFVKPLGRNVGEHEYCLHAAITLMQEAASHLYMDSLSDDEINGRKTQITNIVSSIKRAGKRELERSGQHQEQIQKLEYMLSNVQTINISVVDEAIETSGEQLSITSDFFDNCIQLLKNRRKLTYSMNEEMTKEVPLRFMQPYKPFGVHVYAMSSIMIPFAAQEDSGIFENIPSYLSYAGIGHMISHLVMHGYDTSGVHYQSESFDLMEGFEYYTNLKDGLEEQYQAQQSYKSPSGVTANITMSTLAVNELLADSGAARLAWEAYEMRNEPDPTHAPLSTRQYSTTANRRRRRSSLDVTRRTKREVNDPLPSLDSDEKPLPWLGLSPIKLYFLHWSQHHCSANGGMSLLELTESGEPPSRMRVNLVLQNEPLFNKAFSCTPKTKEMPFILG